MGGRGEGGGGGERGRRRLIPRMIMLTFDTEI